jgi:dienelactone hydrolase
MAEVVLFHHVMGPTVVVEAMADDLRNAGHGVVVPDLFDGRRFSSIDEGAAHVDEVGFGVLLERAAVAVAGLGSELVYSGVSLGVVPAQHLAQTRAGARACLAFEAFVPPSEFGERWPHGVALQVHGMADDPYFAGEGDLAVARAVVEEVQAGPDPAAEAELHVYPGDRHLFTDRSLDAYDDEAAALALGRALEFLDRLDTGG